MTICRTGLRSLVVALVVAVAACGVVPPGPDAGGARVAVPDTPRPMARPEQGAPMADDLDAASPDDRAQARAAPVAGAAMGRTIASLGSPAEPGLWLRTPLVDVVTPGVVVHAPSGARLAVELRPSGGAPGSGSQLSLSAFRAMNLPLTGLPELQVSAQ
jgi:hypothetical protein